MYRALPFLKGGELNFTIVIGFSGNSRLENLSFIYRLH